MLDFMVLSAIASFCGKGVFDILDHLEKNIFGEEKKVKEYIYKLVGLKDISERCIKEGFFDELLYKYYMDSSCSLSLYKTFGPSDIKCGFAHKSNWIGMDVDLTFYNPIEYKGPSAPPLFAGLSWEELYLRLKAYKELGIKVWDAPIYTLNAIETEHGDIKASLGLSSYFKYRFHLGRMQDEIVEAFYHNSVNVDKVLASDALLIRSSNYRKLDDFCEFNQRLTPVGISVLVAMKRDKPWDDYALLLQKRSNLVSEVPNTFAVVPTANHQPMTDPAFEANLTSTIWREIYEELFGGEEAIGATQHLVPEWYKRESEIMAEITTPGVSDVYLTSCGFCLLRGCFDFCVLVVIRSSGIWQKFWHKLRGNWELNNSITPILSSKDKDKINALISMKEWSASSRVSFEQGILRLHKIDPNRVKSDILNESHI